MVRVETPRRSASSDPGQSGRDCRSASIASIRDDVSSMLPIVADSGTSCSYSGASVAVMTTSPADTSIRPFRVEIPQRDLDDLDERLARARLPRPTPAETWDLGTPNSYLAETVAHWRKVFDWREQEARLNAFPQYVADVDGQPVHFVHVPSRVEGATPLLLVHPYPGSFADYVDLIGPLTDPEAHGGDPADAFSVVVPSIPGFGFSTPLADGA